VTLNRYIDAQSKSPGSVTPEDIDTRKSAVQDADAALKQAKANVDAAAAHVQQLAVTQGFEKVYAPFSGTVTARNYDVGALLSPTNTSPGNEIFDLAQDRPAARVRECAAGIFQRHQASDPRPSSLFAHFPAKAFEGVIYATAGAVNPNTRTLSVQINFPNPSGQLFAGGIWRDSSAGDGSRNHRADSHQCADFQRTG